MVEILLCEITLIVNLWLGGSCSESLKKFIASSPLKELLKPIDAGFILRGLISNVSMKDVGKDEA